MRKIVKKIISDRKKGDMFDSHFVIDTIIKDYSDDYLKFAVRNPARSKTTEYVHSEIAKIIASFRGILVQQIPGQSVSYNIRGKISKCALWEKM